MSKARDATGRVAAPWWLILALTLAAIIGVCWIALGGTNLVFDRSTPAGGSRREVTPGGLVAVTLATLAVAASATHAHVIKAQYRRSLEALLRQARHLDDPNPTTPVRATGDGLVADVSNAMSLSALRMRTQLMQERSFSGQAAHQLRTPLTALGLSIEELTMNQATPRHLRADLHRCRNEVDRLAVVIADLLALARRSTLPPASHPSNPSVVAVHAMHRWASSAKAAGRELRVTGTLPDCQVAAPSGPASQVLDVLIDNALKHGAGDIEVSVAVLTDNRVRLRVADQGTSGRRAAGRGYTSAGEGIGLRVAEKLAAACGGHMVRAQHPTTAFDLVLPGQDTALAAAGVPGAHDASR